MTHKTWFGALLGALVLPAVAAAAPEPVAPALSETDVTAAPETDGGDTLIAGTTVVVRGGGVQVAAPRPPINVSGNVRVTVPAPRGVVVPSAPVPSVPPPVRSGGVRVQVNVPPPAVRPPPPPPSYGAPPPPPATVIRPPTYPSYPYRGPTVYFYPRIYTGMWSWWWWTPSWYTPVPPPSPSRPPTAEAPAAEPERRALHVGDTSFGVWGGVNQGVYLDGSLYSDPGIRFSVRHRTSEHLGVDFSGGYYGTTLYPADERNDRRVEVPLQFSGTLHLLPSLPVQLYGLAGITADVRDFQKVGYTSGTKDFYYEEGRFRDMRFGPHLGAGVELMMGPDVSLHADARWTVYSLTDSRSADQTLPVGFTANAGMSFFF